jgi:dipeptidyl aminopeptidase/acylaminoacyl peptidase
MTSTTRLAGAIALALIASAALAKPEPKTIADPKTPAELFAKHPEYSDATLSPTGEYVAATIPFEDRRALSITHLSGGFESKTIKYGPHEMVISPSWVDDKRIVVEKAMDIGYLEQPISTGEWFAADADAGNQLQLFGYVEDDGTKHEKLKDEGPVEMVGTIDGSKGDAVFYYWPWTKSANRNITKLFRVDTRTGKRTELEAINDSVGIYADRAGAPRFLHADDLAGNQYIRYRPHATDQDWVAVPPALAGSRMNFWYFEPDNDHFYASISDHGEPATLYRASISAGTREKVAGNADLEVAVPFTPGHGSAPYAVSYVGGRPKVDFVDPTSEWSKLHAGLMKSFPGELVDIVDVTDDKNKVLFFAHSDRHPGAYYLYDRAANKPTKLFEAMPWIDPAKMSPVSPMEFKNRNGDKIFAYYTAPLGKQGPHALVVLPHGGPFEVTDAWDFDQDVQFLASQGYAVLQVNYRGSSQRGDAFERTGWKGWGTAIQDDIADGVNALVAQNLVNKDKVCIFGASFGGYSAMMNPIRNPGMYKCAIGYAGAYDLERLSKDKDQSPQLKAFFARTMGTDGALFAEQSPAMHVDKLNVPVLLIHGKTDYTARFNQFEAMEAALKRAGKTYETLVKPDEGHGFYSEVNQAEAYDRIGAFLKKYNPVD